MFFAPPARPGPPSPPRGEGRGEGGSGKYRAAGAARRRAVLRLSDDDLREFGYAPSPGPPPGSERTRLWTNARTGETARVPVGIDPGFQHNLGTVSRKAFKTPPPVAAKIARAEDALAVPAFLRRDPTPASPRLYTEFRAHAPGHVARENPPGRAEGYYGGDYIELDRAMRAGERLSGDHARIARAMKPLAGDVTVWRARASAKVHEIDDKAFASSSASWMTAQLFSRFGDGGAMYLMLAPKGTRAVVENETELEVTFAPNQKRRVVEIVDGAHKGYTGPDRVYNGEGRQRLTEGGAMAERDDIQGTIGERMEGAMVVQGPDGRLKEVFSRPPQPGDEEMLARIDANIDALFAGIDDDEAASA